MKKTIRWTLAGALCAVLAGCGDDPYTLYRSSVVMESARIHVATFDADEGDGYNQANCFHAVTLYERQSDVTTRFWCEKGRFRK